MNVSEEIVPFYLTKLTGWKYFPAAMCGNQNVCVANWADKLHSIFFQEADTLFTFLRKYKGIFTKLARIDLCRFETSTAREEALLTSTL